MAREARVSQKSDFTFDHAKDGRTFDSPSLIIAGRQDSMSEYLDAIDLLSGFTRANLAVLDSAGQGLAWECPEVFNTLVRDWLARLARAIWSGPRVSPNSNVAVYAENDWGHTLRRGPNAIKELYATSASIL